MTVEKQTYKILESQTDRASDIEFWDKRQLVKKINLNLSFNMFPKNVKEKNVKKK